MTTKTQISKATKIVPCLTREEVLRLTEEVNEGSKGERNQLLILLLFQTGLRISEALSLTPAKIRRFEGKPALEILGKGKKLVLLPAQKGFQKNSKPMLIKTNSI